MAIHLSALLFSFLLSEVLKSFLANEKLESFNGSFFYQIVRRCLFSLTHRSLPLSFQSIY